ncbi:MULTISPECIES: glycerate kinase [Chroococcidiopsis]|uniref:Glycerate kinase n=1 Tax=Chroococcidiopsis thermalis (strain PCC 7203) TaxID=251229 RepID=K9U2X4_CHRTP|nr:MULTISPECIES: glycerate kinase [Chroococcidiopsis]AFY88993.1 glycerate kinase [Chroococcidiopsis thermalis PCC 7203]PSB48809.1 glycerate kinase [Cyanosarcina cf. burmensis CCALA 770]URD48318.1 glycerate kinase [Chroococcidiopsis sp. CCNUC1]
MTNDQSQLLRSFYPTFEHFCQNTLHKPPQQLEETLRGLWLPLAMQIASYRQAQSRTLIQGILGGQGTGKTTLAKILSLILGHLGYRTLNLSLDDLYKTYSDRLALQQQDPRFIWRGPPGTHDIQLGLQVLDRLRQSEPHSPIEIPRFDKSAWHGAGDRGTPEIVNGADIVLFEGWFVGVRPIDPSNFDRPPPPINTYEDRQFAIYMNTRLQEYLPLWDKLDRLIILYPVDYRLSQQWRKDAEHQMIATGKTGMTDLQIEQFVEYFWKSLHPDLFIKPLIQDSQRVDLVIEINCDRSIGKIYRPGHPS